MESNICTLIECKSIAMQTFLDLYKLEIQKIECRDIKIEYNVKLIKSKKISIEIIIRPSYINGLFYGKRFITTLLRVNKISDKKYKIIKIYKKDYVFYRFLKK